MEASDNPRDGGAKGFATDEVRKRLVNADRRIVLSGIGQELSEMSFRSASNSLIPTQVAAPFANALVNTASEIKRSM